MKQTIPKSGWALKYDPYYPQVFIKIIGYGAHNLNRWISTSAAFKLLIITTHELLGYFETFNIARFTVVKAFCCNMYFLFNLARCVHRHHASCSVSNSMNVCYRPLRQVVNRTLTGHPAARGSSGLEGLRSRSALITLQCAFDLPCRA